MILIVASTRDVAGMNIAQEIVDHYEFERLAETFHKNPVYSKTIQDREVRLLFVKEKIIDKLLMKFDLWD